MSRPVNDPFGKLQTDYGYSMMRKSLFHLGPFCQLSQMSEAFPTMWSSGTKPQNLESCELCRLSPIIQK